jgi:hypothetical protein
MPFLWLVSKSLQAQCVVGRNVIAPVRSGMKMRRHEVKLETRLGKIADVERALLITPVRVGMLEPFVLQELYGEPENDIRRELQASIRLRHLLTTMSTTCGDRKHIAVVNDGEFCSEHHNQLQRIMDEIRNEMPPTMVVAAAAKVPSESGTYRVIALSFHGLRCTVGIS